MVSTTVQRIQCGGCKKFFVGLTLFDAHRVGDASKRERRCKTDEEMQAAGYATERRPVRFIVEGVTIPEERDVWFDPVARELLAKAFHKGEEEDEQE